MTEFVIECYHCKTKFTKTMEGGIPMFNQVKKNDWLSIECPLCGSINKCAKFRDNSTLLLALGS